MAFNFNGNTPKKILYNGLNVAKLVYNGVVVWMSKVLAAISGILPLTLTNSTGDDLVDYRIYGANGGVGDKTDNLWNEKATTDTDKYINASGNIVTGASGDRFLYLKVNVSPSTNYVFKWTENVLGTDDNTAYIRISEYTQSNRFIRRVLCNCSEQTQKAFSFTTASNTSYIDVRTDSATSIRGQYLTGVMLITGTSIPETYEPYGYKVPVRCGGTTTNIYLDEPLRKTSKLPSGYTELEHIRSTGTQYIDTGLKGNLNTEAIIKVNQITASSQNTITIFGDRTNSSKAIAINLPTNVSNNQQRFGDKSVIYNTPLSLEVDYVLKINKSGLYIDNTKIVTFNTTTEFETESNLQLFKVSGIVGSFYNGTAKIYYCKIYDDGVLVRNFIPCKNPSNVVGMYDTVNDVFYSNAGSGSFIAGAEVETVYYTDYLDYENQKVVRNVDDNDKGIDTSIEESVVLPAVPTDEGTTVFDVDTDVTPSYAEVKYYTKPIENKTLKTSDNLVFVTSDNKIFKLKEEE